MAHLVAYAQLSTTDNAVAGNLVKAQCDFCGKKYGSIKEAQHCEAEHIRQAVGDSIKDSIRRGLF